MYIIIGLLVILWLLGVVIRIGGAFIHLLLVLALIAFIYRMVVGRKA